jgi:hypothetical protein
VTVETGVKPGVVTHVRSGIEALVAPHLAPGIETLMAPHLAPGVEGAGVPSRCCTDAHASTTLGLRRLNPPERGDSEGRQRQHGSRSFWSIVRTVSL